MERKQYCVICKHYGIHTEPETELDRANLYDEDGMSLTILLCRKHSVQLFKMGQKMFLLNHYKILVDLMDSDDTKFLQILEDTVKNNKDKLT